MRKEGKLMRRTQKQLRNNRNVSDQGNLNNENLGAVESDRRGGVEIACSIRLNLTLLQQESHQKYPQKQLKR